jgi:hypothetical protein
MKHVKLFEDFGSSQGAEQQMVLFIPAEDSFEVLSTSKEMLDSIDIDALNKSLNLPEFKVTALPVRNGEQYLKYSYGPDSYDGIPELISKADAERLYAQNPYAMLATTNGNMIAFVETQEYEYSDDKGMWLIPIIPETCIYVNGQYGDIEIKGKASTRLLGFGDNRRNDGKPYHFFN